MDAVIEYREVLISGTLVTISLAILSLVLSVVCGLAGVYLRMSSSPFLQRAGTVYVTLIRSVPELVLMMLVFYGGQVALNQLGAATGLWEYIEINQFWAGVLTLGFIFGAYMTETFRGAILAVPKGQLEAAVATGMRPRKIFTVITWPQMVRYALPSFANNWLVLVKSTALVSVIGLHDLVWNAVSAGRSVQQLFSFMIAVLFIYLVITAVSDLLLCWANRKYSAGMARG